MKRQKDMTLEEEPHRLEGVHYTTEKGREQLLVAPERMKQLSQSKKKYLVVEVSGGETKV